MPVVVQPATAIAAKDAAAALIDTSFMLVLLSMRRTEKIAPGSITHGR
jgi:hypothetical protein